MANSRSFDPLILGLLAFSLIGNVYLGVRLAAARPPGAPPSVAEPLRVGEPVVPLEAEDVTGAKRVVNPSDADVNTVFYVFTPTCPWCARNLPNLQALAAAQGSKFRLVGISLDPKVQPYIQEHGLTFPILVNPSAEARRAYGLGAVPKTIVVSPRGEVLKVWRGAYGGGTAADVSAFFGVALPGFREPVN
jgi:peroxiredoxin